jgi:hypothetical protein
LAWWGKPPDKEGAVNCGSFAIVQLYHINDAGLPDDPLLYREPWHTTVKLNEAGTETRVRVERGPIFNKNGTTKPDWDPLFRVPVFVMTVDDKYQYPDGSSFSERDLYTGKFIEGIKYFLTPIQNRIKRSKDTRVAELRSAAEDLGGEIGERLWHKANRPDTAADNTIAYKHVKDQVAKNDYFVQNDKLDDVF